MAWFALEPVVAPMLAADRDRRFFDPADKTVKPVWTERGGYVKNPSATPLDDAMKNGRVGGGFENGTFMYVVDTDGRVILGKRLGEPGGQAAVRVVRPTRSHFPVQLLDATACVVLAATTIAVGDSGAAPWAATAAGAGGYLLARALLDELRDERVRTRRLTEAQRLALAAITCSALAGAIVLVQR